VQKRYRILVDVLKIVSGLVFFLGLLAGVSAFTRIGGVPNGLLFILGGLLAALILSAVSATVDLLASIEVNTYEIVTYSRRRAQFQPGKLQASARQKTDEVPTAREQGAHPLTRNRQDQNHE